MTPNCTHPADSWNFGVIEKRTRACCFKIALEIMLLPMLTTLNITGLKIRMTCMIMTQYAHRKIVDALFIYDDLN